MANGTEISNGGLFNRIASAWSRFWFTPADPTPLAFMRIVAGLLTIYIHVAYTFDLAAFFGPNAWYDQATANMRRQTMPFMVQQNSWSDREFYYQLPSDVGQRRALRHFIDGYFRSQTEAHAEFLRSLSGAPDERSALMRWLRTLPDDPAGRNALLERYAADTVTPDERGGLPGYLIMQPTADSRLQLSAAIKRFYGLLPQSLHDRQGLFTLFQDLNGLDWIGFQEFLRRLPATEKDRTYTLDFLESWNVDPKHAYHIGIDTYSPWFYVTDIRLMWAIHLAHLAVMVLFTLGLWTRVTSVLTWLAGLAYINRAQPVLFGQDTMMNLCLFYLMIAPCGAVWSLDWLINRYRSARKVLAGGKPLVNDAMVQPLVSAGFVIRLLQVHYCLMYMSAGLAKLKGNSWWTGTAPWACLANPEFAPMHMAIYVDTLSWLCQHRWLWEVSMNASVVFTLVIEIGFPSLVWTRLRPVFVAGAMLLHLGIAVIMGLSVFSLFMFALLICWIPADVIRWCFARRPAELPKWRLKYHGKASDQAEAAARVYALDVWNQVEYADADATRYSQAVETVTLEPVDRAGPPVAPSVGVVSTFGFFHALSWLPGVKLLAKWLLAAKSTTAPKTRNDERMPIGSGRV